RRRGSRDGQRGARALACTAARQKPAARVRRWNGDRRGGADSRCCSRWDALRSRRRRPLDWTIPNLVTSAPTVDSSYVTRDGRSLETAPSQWARHVDVKRLFGWMSRISPSITVKLPSPTNAYDCLPPNVPAVVRNVVATDSVNAKSTNATVA